ncbi:helix-hairpin-helix domain-containing protein [Haloarcula litorea]|uniref:helix-hairpin-helix domain-containing protein n=1 Tax=Haloarcula litorea TaxID=3032579 RepID=UPI0023E78954|nr:helix-hairpin-helix domain-containing protein [Halomicroarcula sp. GDY20]
MGLLEKLKSALGLDGTESASDGSAGDVDVTVEREPSTDDEDAVKGTDTATDESDGEATAADDTSEDVGEADAGEAEPVPTDDADIDAETDAEPDIPEAEPDEGSDDPVTEIKGIGPAYAKRLQGIGIDTVGDLAGADAGEIASETDLSESRVSGWIEQAETY